MDERRVGVFSPDLFDSWSGVQPHSAVLPSSPSNRLRPLQPSPYKCAFTFRRDYLCSYSFSRFSAFKQLPNTSIEDLFCSFCAIKVFQKRWRNRCFWAQRGSLDGVDLQLHLHYIVSRVPSTLALHVQYCWNFMNFSPQHMVIAFCVRRCYENFLQNAVLRPKHISSCSWCVRFVQSLGKQPVGLNQCCISRFFFFPYLSKFGVEITQHYHRSWFDLIIEPFSLVVRSITFESFVAFIGIMTKEQQPYLWRANMTSKS